MATNPIEEYPTANEIRKLGIEALTRELGPAGMARFMQQFDSGEGDYTKERAALLDGVTMDDIMRDLAEKRAAEERNAK